MMSLPKQAKRLLVSVSRFLNEIIFARNHILSSLLNMYYVKSRSKGSIPIPGLEID
jgi:hypothetical protein